MNEIPKIPLNHIARGVALHTPNLSFAPQQKRYKPEWQMLSLRSTLLQYLPLFLHMSFRSNMSHMLQLKAC